MNEDTYLHDSFDDRTTFHSQKPAKENNSETTYSITKVFGYMFMWLAITTVITFGLAFLFNYLLGNATTDESKSDIFVAIIATTIVSGLAVIIMSIVTHFVLFKGKHSIAVPASIYASLMGVMMGAFAGIITYFYENGWLLLGISFGITTLAFGLMTLIALLSKSRLNALPIIGFGLLFGLLLMSGVMFIIMIFFPSMYQWWYWVLTLGLLVVVMLTTIWDIRNVKTLAENGALNKNISMYVAFNLYVDFIYILLRVLLILLRLFGRGRN